MAGNNLQIKFVILLQNNCYNVGNKQRPLYSLHPVQRRYDCFQFQHPEILCLSFVATFMFQKSLYRVDTLQSLQKLLT